MTAGYQFKLPDIGEGVHEGEIVQWLVAEGDTITEDQSLLEVMTDKVTAEIPSPVNGRVAQLHGKVGDVVAVGAVVVTFASEASADVQEPPVKTTLPSTLSPGDVATAQQTDPTSQPLSVASTVLATPATRKLARTLGVDLSLIQGTGDNGRITANDVQQAADAKTTAPQSMDNGQSYKPTSTADMPLTVAETSPAFVPPQPTFSRFTSADITPGSTNKPEFTPPAKGPSVSPSLNQTIQTRPFVGVRRKIAQHLTQAKQTAPHFGYVDEVDMTAIVTLRQQLKPQADNDQVKLHYLPFIMMAVCRALKAHPIVNSSLDEANGQIVLHDAINLGFAVAAEQGLVVPVIHQANILSIKQLAERIDTLATKARAGLLGRDEVQGGTFTVTSIGSIGGLFGLPIINLPEVAILGVNKIMRRPVAVTDPLTGQESVAIRDMMYLSISCDHRVVDGSDAAQFVNTVIQQLQNPVLWLYN